MGIFDKIKGAYIAFQNVEKPQPKSANIISKIAYEEQLHRVRQDATKYRTAIQAAESIKYPNRYLLYQLYQQVINDGQIQSAMLQRKMRVLNASFSLLNAEGEEDEKTSIIKAQWFYDFLDMALDSIFYGHSLVQFGAVKNDKFTDVILVPRQYVIPEFNIVRETTATVVDGIDYTEKPYSNWVIGVGRKRDLGLLMKLAPYAIWKNNAMAAWAEFAEIFGVPMRVAKTDVRDEATRKNAENMMRNFGVATWGVFDLNDQFEIIEASRSDAFNVFDKMVERCNSEISKIILGQTGTTDEKAYSGSANVHSEIAKGIGLQDMRMIEHVVNDQLLPLMLNLGFAVDGLRFEFNRAESLSIEQKAKIDASFMPYVKYNKEYLERVYKIELDDDDDIEDSQETEIDNEDNDTKSISNKLKKLYR